MAPVGRSRSSRTSSAATRPCSTRASTTCSISRTRWRPKTARRGSASRPWITSSGRTIASARRYASKRERSSSRSPRSSSGAAPKVEEAVASSGGERDEDGRMVRGSSARIRGADREGQGRGVLLPRMARLVDPRRNGVPRFRGGSHGEPMIRRPRETGLLVLAFGMAIAATFISIYLLGELEKDVWNVYCSSGLHWDPCDMGSAWSGADRGELLTGGDYRALLGA